MDGDPNLKGNVAEAAIRLAAVKLGLHVLEPVTEHCRYDMAFDLGERIYRIQCKWAPLRGEVIEVGLQTSRWTPRGDVRTTYTVDEIDAVAVYCEALDECYLLPVRVVAGRRGISLRTGPPKNGQRAGLNWAAEYALHGAVAQLGRALPWHGRGRRFESDQLHSPDSANSTTVGAHEFRNRFGWYMERAAAGETFNVTRHGKPYVRLTGPQEALALKAA